MRGQRSKRPTLGRRGGPGLLQGPSSLAPALALALLLGPAMIAPQGGGGLLSAIAQVPGPETFDKDPQTPMELWAAIDYLVRTGQAKKAVPYLEKLVKT